MKKKAVCKDVIIAESDNLVNVEGNYYFPKNSVNMAYLKESDTHTTCYWKGVAHYYTIAVHGDENRDAAWFYPTPKDAAKQIKDRIAFWCGVKVVDA